MQGLLPEAYAGYAQRVFATLTQGKTFTAEADVAEAVWRSATEVDGPLRAGRPGPTPLQWRAGLRHETTPQACTCGAFALRRAHPGGRGSVSAI